MRGSNHRRIRRLRAMLYYRSVRLCVDLHTVFEVRDEGLRLLAIVVIVCGEGKQRACVSVQPIAVLPEILESNSLKLAHFRLFLHRVIDGQRVKHPCLRVVIRFFLDEFFIKKRNGPRSEEHTSELQSRRDLVCRLLLEKKKK